MKVKNKYYVELTDTFAGDANYSWLKRFIISANTQRGAIIKLSKETGFNLELIMLAKFPAIMLKMHVSVPL